MLIRSFPDNGRQLTALLRDNSRQLLRAYRSIAQAIRDERAIAPAAEWLVDNFHVIEDQIREIHDDLPAAITSSCRNLPMVHSKDIRVYLE